MGGPRPLPSTQLAQSIRDRMDDANLPVWPVKPIRYLIRNAGRTYPYIEVGGWQNPVASRVLLELENLTNRSAAAELKNPRYQDRLADAVVKGIMDHGRVRLGPARTR